VEGVSVFDAGSVGPLTLASGAGLDAGTRTGGAATEVTGDLHAEAGSTLAFELPGSTEWLPTRVDASGHVFLDGATLQTGEGCVAAGSTYTLIEAAEGVSGTLVAPDGTPIAAGEVLPGTPDGCGPGSSAPPLRIDYLNDIISATALSGPEAPTQTGTQHSTSGGGGGATVTSPSTGVESYVVAARTLLAKVLSMAGGHKRIGPLLRHDGETTMVGASIDGSLQVRWVARHAGRTVTLAVGSVNIGSSGNGRLRISLTRRGRLLLGHERLIRGHALASLSSPGRAVAMQSVLLQLRR